jgi:class 3 adenylate cyclase
MADFPKPVDTRPQLVLPSKAALISQFDARERALQERSEELLDFEKQLQEGQDKLQATLQQLEVRTRALQEGELLLKNHKLLHQKSAARLLDQNELVALRAELEHQRLELQRKGTFQTQTETRLNEQFSSREEDLRKREAWVSFEHEKATLNNTRRLQAIVFTDVVSFSALMQANEALTIQKVRTDLQRMQMEGKARGGMLINTMGDGMLMIFPSAIQAVKFSLWMQKSFNENCGEGGLRHRFGIHIADVALLPDGGIAGDGVNIASRLEAQAPPGGVCLSAVTHALVKGKLPLPPSVAEEITLKNISEPVAVHQFTSQAILAAAGANDTPPADMQPAGTAPG